MHVAMENPSCRKVSDLSFYTYVSICKKLMYLFVILQQNGFVIISNSKQSRVSKFDSRWALGMYIFSLS